VNPQPQSTAIAGAFLWLFSTALFTFHERPIESPHLAVLASQVTKGDLKAVERFWTEVTEKGTPLVESTGSDAGELRVTFLFRGGEETNNVVIMANNGLWGDIPSNRMERLAATDVWYRTYRFRADARFTYSLSVNDPLTPLTGIQDVGEWLKRSAGWRPDPLNPRLFAAYPRVLSVVELPKAPAQPWVEEKPGVPKGQVQIHKVKSAVLGNERTVWVYTPAGYGKTTVPCGLLILFDGGAYTSWVPTPVILDNLIFEGRIPPLVAAFVGHPSLPVRNSELSCSLPFTRFLTAEFLTWLRRSYAVTEDPKLTVIGGSSNGGLGAAFAAFRHPEVFGNVLSQSGAFMYNPADDSEPEWLVRQVTASRVLPIRFHLDCGLMETHPAAGDSPDILTANRHMRDALLRKGYWLHYQEFNGGHEYLNWRGTLAEGLIALLRGAVSRQ
jgi:enterochelin esterase family protein